MDKEMQARMKLWDLGFRRVVRTLRNAMVT